MRNLICLAFFYAIIGSGSLNGQSNIILPELEAVTTPRCKIFAQWVPSEEFLARNLNFKNTGEYSINPYSFVRRKKQNKMQALGYAVEKFGSKEFQAHWTIANGKLALPGTVHLGFDNCKIPISGGKAILANHSAGSTFTAYRDESISKEEFDITNRFIQWTLNDLAYKKIEGPFVCADINKSLLMDSLSSLKDLFLEFEHVQTVSTTRAFSDHKLFFMSLPGYFTPLPYYFGLSSLIRRHPGVALIPSFSLYKLHVKDASGKELKTFSQAIFIEEHHRLGRAASYIDLLFKETAPVAIESLLNQFLNDELLLDEIRKHDATMDSLLVANPNFAHLARLQQRYSTLFNQKKIVYEKMQEIEQQLNSMGAPMDASIISANYRPSYNANISSQANANIDMAGQTALMMFSTISNAAKKAKINRAQDQFRKLGKQLDMLESNEQALKLEMGNYVKDKKALDQFFASSDDMDKRLASLSQSVREQANASKQEIAGANSSLSNWYNSSVSAFNSNLTASSAQTPGATADNGAGSQGSTGDSPEIQRCAKQAADEFEGSRHKKIIDKLNVTNGDSRYFDLAYWKSVECQYRVCGPYLSAEEKNALLKVMKEIEARINAKGGTGGLMVGFN